MGWATFSLQEHCRRQAAQWWRESGGAQHGSGVGGDGVPSSSVQSRGSWPWVRSLDRSAVCALALIPGLVHYCAPCQGSRHLERVRLKLLQIPPGSPCSGYHSSGERGFQGSEPQSVTCKLDTWGKSSLSDSLCPFLENALMRQAPCSSGQNQTWSLGLVLLN